MLDCRAGAGLGTGTAGSGWDEWASVAEADDVIDIASEAGAAGGGDLCLASSPALGILGFGGHSRRSFNSSLAESPVCCDATLDVRGAVGVRDWRLVCCSKRPMRFATL